MSELQSMTTAQALEAALATGVRFVKDLIKGFQGGHEAYTVKADGAYIGTIWFVRAERRWHTSVTVETYESSHHAVLDLWAAKAEMGF